MQNLSANTYVTLRSNASGNLYSNTCYNFTNQLCTTLNFKDKTRVALSEIHLPLNFRLEGKQGNINQILVQTDLVDDSIFGDSRLNILKLVTIDKNFYTYDTQVLLFKNLFFYPLSRNSFNNVTINITDTFGNVLNVNSASLSSVVETFVVLHFK